MGQYLSNLIRQMHAGKIAAGAAGELEMLTNSVKYLNAKVREIDARLTQVEDERRP